MDLTRIRASMSRKRKAKEQARSSTTDSRNLINDHHAYSPELLRDSSPEASPEHLPHATNDGAHAPELLRDSSQEASPEQLRAHSPEILRDSSQEASPPHGTHSPEILRDSSQEASEHLPHMTEDGTHSPELLRDSSQEASPEHLPRATKDGYELSPDHEIWFFVKNTQREFLKETESGEVKMIKADINIIKGLPLHLRDCLVTMIRYCDENKFLMAQQLYYDTVIGRSPWPRGVKVGATINGSEDAYILWGAETRNFLHTFKRLISFREMQYQQKGACKYCKLSPEEEIYGYYQLSPEEKIYNFMKKTQIELAKEIDSSEVKMIKADIDLNVLNFCSIKELPTHLRDCLVTTIRYCDMKNFLMAQQFYIDTVIGRAPWPRGVKVGAAVNGNEDAYILWGALTRNFLHAFKRLISFRERQYQQKV